MKKGLVLEGGAMRGMFTSGVLDCMMEDGIEFDGIVGVSAGAAFGCNYKSRQIGRSIRYNVRFARDIRYCSMLSLLFTGNLFSEKFCYHTVPEKLDIFDLDTFNKNPMEFHLVVTDIVTGKPVYKKLENCDTSCFDWVRASSSLPLVAKVVELDGLKLLDGGITDSIPIKFAQSIGYEKNIVILTQPRDFVKEKSGGMGFMRFYLKKYPKLIEAIENRHNLYNETLEYIRKQEKEGKILVISPPDALPIKRVEHNPDVLLDVYKTGKNVAMNMLSEIKDFLKD